MNNEIIFFSIWTVFYIYFIQIVNPYYEILQTNYHFQLSYMINPKNKFILVLNKEYLINHLYFFLLQFKIYFIYSISYMVIVSLIRKKYNYIIYLLTFYFILINIFFIIFIFINLNCFLSYRTIFSFDNFFLINFNSQRGIKLSLNNPRRCHRRHR